MEGGAQTLLRRLGVVVPARDERLGIGCCLLALDEAARRARCGLEVVVVLDSCVDGTDAVVASLLPTLASSVHRVEIEAASVGTARRVGMSHLLDILGPGDHWVSTTDADSAVPPSWFRRQLTHRAAGASLVAGTVHVPRWEGRQRLGPRWEQEYAADGHRHVHGANLSFLSTAYRRAGGFPDLTSEEDVALVREFARRREQIAWATDLSVATSPRVVGRAPNGFAAHLNQLANAVPNEHVRGVAAMEAW
ncbi:MAG: glycosyltransferase [Nocardioidaceae bacterium]